MNKAQETALFGLAALAQEWALNKERILSEFGRFQTFFKRYETLCAATIVRDEVHKDAWINEGFSFFLAFGCAQNADRNRSHYEYEASAEEQEEEFDVTMALETFLDQGYLISDSTAYMWGGYHKEHKVVWRCAHCADLPSAIPSVTDIIVFSHGGSGHWHSWRYPPTHKVDRAMRKKIRRAMLQAGYDRENVDSFYRRLAN